VKIADINIHSPAGAQIALTRIRNGAAQFCDADGGRVPLNRAAPINRCVADMTRRAVDQLNATTVAERYGRQQARQTSR